MMIYDDIMCDSEESKVKSCDTSQSFLSTELDLILQYSYHAVMSINVWAFLPTKMSGFDNWAYYEIAEW